jgi:hypothetical protein
MSTAPPLSKGLLRAEPAVQAVRDQERPFTIISAISEYTRGNLKVAAVLTRANRLPASQFSRSCGGIHPATSRTFDQRGLLLAQRRRLHRSTTAEAPGGCCTGMASPLAVRLLRMRVATTRLARVIARLPVLRAILQFAHHPLELKFCRRMHLRPQVRKKA